MNPSEKAVPFALYFASDAYSTAKKIMGRQSAGKALIKGIARTWPQNPVYGLGPSPTGGQALADQLHKDGFQSEVRWSRLPDLSAAQDAGTLYYPAPPTKEIAHLRNLHQPASFSIMGVTHTLSSGGAMEQITDLLLPPFRPWDALICTSQCGRDLVVALHNQMADWWQNQVGAIRLNTPQLPVIPLGVDVPYFTKPATGKAQSREQLGITPDDVVFLFTGRLAFHAKANPIPMYQALEKAAEHAPIVCVEAGVYPNESIRQSYLVAQRSIAPSVKFISVDGQDEARYRQSWEAADVFVSLSDNIQETFGLTPIEAKAAGLPVIVADWNGYKETVRDGIDGYRIPTILPPTGVGQDLAMRHAFGQDTYDLFIGRTSVATVVDPILLAEAIKRLATDSALRASMGAAGRQHARQVYDWPVILKQYAALAVQLTELRQQGQSEQTQPWPQRPDPFASFGHFSTTTLKGDACVLAQPDAPARLNTLLTLNMANYAFTPPVLVAETILSLFRSIQSQEAITVNELLAAAGHANPSGVRALMWLWKFDVIQIKART